MVKLLGLDTRSPDDSTGSRTDLTRQFMAGLTTYTIYPFHRIISTGLKKQLRVNVDIEDSHGERWYYFHIMGLDRYLFQLAKDHYFPRGFAAVCKDTPGNIVGWVGFLPKFDNDEPQASIVAAHYDDIQKMEFSLKFSGSLGMLGAFTVDHQDYFFFSAKNSCGKYSREFGRLFTEWTINHSVDQQALHKAMVDQRYTISFETCYKSGEFGYHGTRYKSEFPVAIAIGRPETSTSKMFSWLGANEAQEFFVRHKLPCGPRYLIDSSENVVRVLRAINDNRDDMTDTLLQKIIKDLDCITIVPGTIMHSELSDVLEGLVLWLYKSDSVKILKFKFPLYTIMTMLIRSLVTDRETPVTSATPIKESVKLLVKVSTAVEKYVKRWVLVKRNYFFRMAIYILEKIVEIPQGLTSYNYLDYLEPVKEQFLALPAEAQAIDISAYTGATITVYLLVGPVGAGKSTARQFIEKEYGLSGVGFDGCGEDYNREIKNRKLWGSVAHGKQVIENGGSAFLEPLESLLEPYFLSPFKVEPVLIMPQELLVALDSRNGREDGDVLAAVLKDFKERTKEVVHQRAKDGIYQMDEKELEQIFYGPGGVTERNFQAQVKLYHMARQNGQQVVGFSRAPGGQFRFSSPLKIVPPHTIRTTPITWGYNVQFEDDGIKNVHATMEYGVRDVSAEHDRPPRGPVECNRITFTVLDGKKKKNGDIIVLPKGVLTRKDGVPTHCTIHELHPLVERRLSGRIIQILLENSPVTPEDRILNTVKLVRERPVTITIGRLYAYCLQK